MNIRKENNKLTLSAWDQKDPINRTFFSGLFFLLVYYSFGFQTAFIALSLLILVALAIHFIECRTNNASAYFDFQANTIVFTKAFLGFTLDQSELEDVDFNQLVFTAYPRNQFGQKKYQLEYQTQESCVVVYRVDSKEQKVVIEAELKRLN
jgi:hypothetical protein